MNKKHEKKPEETETPVEQTQPAEENTESLKSAAEIALEKAPHETESGKSESDKVSLLSEELEALRQQAAKATEHWDRLLRTQAEHENYRKRITRERQDLIKSANEKLLSEILTPLDHFEMGLSTTPRIDPPDPFRQGMEMVLQQFQQFLKSQGVSEIESIGQSFNPLFHEAVAHQESDTVPEGQIMHQIKKGYRLNDKLLRAATVIVSKGKPTVVEPQSEPPPSESTQAD